MTWLIGVGLLRDSDNHDVANSSIRVRQFATVWHVGTVVTFFLWLATPVVSGDTAAAAGPDECVNQCELSHTQCVKSKSYRLREIACGVRSLKCIAECRSKSR